MAGFRVVLLRSGSDVMMKHDPFPFVLEELQPIRPTVKQAFGFTYVYLEDRLLCCLRDSSRKSSTNELWLFATAKHVESQSKEFPELPRRYLWRSGKKA